MKCRNLKKMNKKVLSGIICLVIIVIIFIPLGLKMGTSNMLNTLMNTAHDLLLNTVFYLLAVCVLTGALGKILIEFGVVDLLEKILRPIMKPVFNLPGVASLGAILTFLSDNPAIIALAKDKQFSVYFKKYQYISLTNFGTSFGMGLLVIVFMMGQGYYAEPLIGFIGAIIGCIISTRLMQFLVIKDYPRFKEENALDQSEIIKLESAEDNQETKDNSSRKSLFQRILDSLLDGGKDGVEVGMSVIPGVLIISTFIMILTFGPSANGYTGSAYEGVGVLPWIGDKLSWLFNFLFGFNDPHLIAFPITALGAVGAALGLIPNFAANGWLDANAIAVFTAIGMCWSGFLSTHTAMLDTLKYRSLTSKAIISHTIGGIFAAIAAHFGYMLFALFL